MKGNQEVVSPGEVVQGYRMVRKLGSGGFAQVYLGRRRRRRVALKFIPLAHAEEWAKRELTILLHFQHPNVVKLLGHAQGPEGAPEHLVLIMEYVKGRTLGEWVREENPTAREVARMARKLSHALAAVHAAGVLHRDFKPENVVVRDADGEPVLVDFGTSGVPWAPPVTSEGVAPGTPAFRSPEYVLYLVDTQRSLDAPYEYSRADDLYALGVTLYLMLTDAFPSAGSGLDLMREIAREVPRTPHERNRRVPRALSALCMKMLEKEPQARFASAEALGEALEALLAEARGDPSWDVPLAYGWDAAGRTTAFELALQDPEDPLPLWARKNLKPRRGRKPAPPARARLRWLPWVGGACGLLLAGLGAGYLLFARDSPESGSPETAAPAGPALAALLRATFPEGEPTPEACFVREVAPPWKPPEAGASAAPARVETPAPVVPVTTLRKGETLVKQKSKDRSGNPTRDTRARKKGGASELALLCAAAANAACAGAPVQPVRPMPAPEACPPGAVDVMTDRFDIPIGGSSPGLYFEEANLDDPKPIPVREGPVTLFLGAPWNKLPDGTYLDGRLVYGPERVYGRFTQARLENGETVPVCFALETQTYGEPLGLPLEGRDESGTPLVYPFVQVEAVWSFE